MSKVIPGTIDKLRTGIPGLDLITAGGLPAGRTTLVVGTTGSAKTVFAAQFLAAGIAEANDPGVFVTFEERPQDIRRNVLGFGWDVAAWEEQGLWSFVDASPEPTQESVVAGEYDLGALLVRVENAVRRTNARRVAMDSLGAVFSQFEDSYVVRRELLRIADALKSMGVTSVLTNEAEHELSYVGRHGVEEFVSDNVMILRNMLEDEKRRRTVEVLKFRGTVHQKGQFPFTVLPGEGIVVIPLSALELEQRSSEVRISSGNAELDAMCGGGFFRDSIILVSGATGTGKTLTGTHFLRGGVDAGQRVLLFAFEESREQLFRNASGWGSDFERHEREGLLKVVCEYPEARGLEDLLISMRAQIHEFKPQRVAVDSLSALERVASNRGFREFVIALTSFIKHQEIAGLFTASTPTLMGGESITEAHISTLTDTIILLRYVEMFGEIRRGMAVLKMRGSSHEKTIRELVIDGQGMHIGRPFYGVAGILSGHPMQLQGSEVSRLDQMFLGDDETGGLAG